MSLRPRVVALGLAFQLLASCDQWSLRVNSEGLLSISIVSHGGRQRDGYRVRTRLPDGRTRVLEVPASGELPLNAVDPGVYELTLLPPSGCVVSSPNPRTLTVSPDEVISLTFDVDCSR